MTRFAENGQRTARPELLGAFEKIGVLLSGVNIPRPRDAKTPADLKLSYEIHRIPSPNDATLESWYVAGRDKGPIIVMFHGYAASKSSLLTAAKGVHDMGYGVLLVDFFGSGASTGSGTTVGVKEADDVVATVGYVRQRWPNRKVVLYGISMGGAAVLRAIAIGNVNPSAVIVEATFDRLLNTTRNRFQVMGLPGSPFAELLLFWGSVQHGFNLFSHNPMDYARSVRCPTLILHGEKDTRVTVGQARTIASAMGKFSRFIQYANVPHMPIVESRPEDWQRDVAAFLVQVR